MKNLTKILIALGLIGASITLSYLDKKINPLMGYIEDQNKIIYQEYRDNSLLEK